MVYFLRDIAVFGLLVVFVGFSASGWAEDEIREIEVHQLDEVVVTAPAVIEGNKVNRYGSQVTVVTEEQIKNLNAQDLTSALRRVPGVVISRHNPIGSFGGGEGGAVFIRGHGSSRPGAEIQTLIDGIPKFVSIWTHPLMDVLNVDIVQSVNVYKGAQPVLFGNMAFGAIDIQTKRMQEEGFRTSVHGAYGSYHTRIGTMEHGGRIDRLDYYLLGGYRRSSGHRDNSDGELQDYFGRLGYAFSPNWDLNFTFIRTNNWADDPGRADNSAPSDGRFNTDDYFTVTTLANSYDTAEGYVKLYWDKGDIDWVNQEETPGMDTLTDYQNYGIRVRETLTPWEGGEILMGMDNDNISGEVRIFDPTNVNQFFPKETFRITSPYVLLSHLFGSKDDFYVMPSAGIRYLDHSRFDDEMGPQAGLVLGFQKTEFNVSYARGINYPGIYARVQEDLFLPGNNEWESLTAETMDHYEAGIAYTFNSFEKIDLTCFYDSGKDRIVVSPPPPFPPVLKNISTYRLRGIEGTVTLAPSDAMTWFLGATYLHASPGDLPYTPRWTMSSGINYRFLKSFQLSMDAMFMDGQFVTSRARQNGTVNTDEVGSYFLVNGKITWDVVLPFQKLDCQLYVAGENMTDTDYEQKKDYPMPGINGMVGMIVNF